MWVMMKEEEINNATKESEQWKRSLKYEEEELAAITVWAVLLDR